MPNHATLDEIFVVHYLLFHFRLERDLYTRKDKFGVEIYERTKWDIRESMVSKNPIV